jgi:hypothetical protein
MAILATAEAAGMTQEMFAELASKLSGDLRNAPGLVFHTSGPIASGWKVTEVWQSREDCESWYDNKVKPALHPGVELALTFEDVFRVVRPALASSTPSST